MARQIQIRRGTTLENDNFTGAIGEITMDTDAKTLRVHDGETPGGVALAKESEILDIASADYVIEWQNPTAENNYTWYRKYKSGWVEQGGYIDKLNNTNKTVYFPIEMQNTYYSIAVVGLNEMSGVSSYATIPRNPQTTSLNIATTANYSAGARWIITGMGA